MNILPARIAALVLLTLFALPNPATGQEAAVPLEPAKQQMLFRGEYSNYAWGYRHHGWYVDAKGGIYTFQYVKLGSRTKLKTVVPKRVGQVDPKTLNAKRSLIPLAAKSTLVRKHAAYDAGVSTLTAYLPDKETGKYREVELSVSGDVKGENPSTAAKELVRWLTSLKPE